MALTKLNLHNTQVVGDVKGLGDLVALTKLDLFNTQVQGGRGLGELRKYQETLKTSKASTS